jgi:hypothetical protein
MALDPEQAHAYVRQAAIDGIAACLVGEVCVGTGLEVD